MRVERSLTGKTGWNYREALVVVQDWQWKLNSKGQRERIYNLIFKTKRV